MTLVLTKETICDELGVSSLIISLFIIFTHRENIKRMIKGKEECNFESSKLSKREWNELMESFNFKEKII